MLRLMKVFFGFLSEEESKRGRGTGKAPVAVALSLDKAGRPEFIKTQILAKVDGNTITGFAKKTVESGSTISSDGLSMYHKLSKNGCEHIS